MKKRIIRLYIPGSKKGLIDENNIWDYLKMKPIKDVKFVSYDFIKRRRVDEKNTVLTRDPNGHGLRVVPLREESA